MPKHRVIKGVLGTFFGIFLSRNADWLGYALLGQFVAQCSRLEIDLLHWLPPDRAPEAARGATVVARAVFASAMRKQGLESYPLQSAVLELTRGDHEIDVLNYGVQRGYELHVSITVVAPAGQVHVREKWIIVANHDPTLESRRYAGQWGPWRLDA